MTQMLDELRELERQNYLQEQKLETQKKAVRNNEHNTTLTYFSTDGRKVILMTELIRKMEDKLAKQTRMVIRKENIKNFQFVNPNTKRKNTPTIALVSSKSNPDVFYEVKPSILYGLSSNDKGWIMNGRGNRTSAITDAVAEKIMVV